jgi:integrase
MTKPPIIKPSVTADFMKMLAKFPAAQQKAFIDGLKQSAIRREKKRKQETKGQPALFWYCRTESGWRYLPAKQQTEPGVPAYPDGRFMLRQMVNGKRVYKPVVASVAAELLTIARTAHASKKMARKVTESKPTLREAIAEFLTKKAKYPVAQEVYGRHLDEFLKVCQEHGVRYVSDIKPEHLDFYRDGLKQKDITVANKTRSVRSFLKAANYDTKTLGRYDAPEPKEVDTYEPDEVAAMLAHADEYMTLCIRIGCELGLRDQELQCCEFSDFNRAKLTVSVKSKPHLLFKVKTRESKRTVPVSPSLMNLIDVWQQKRKTSPTLAGKGHTLILGLNGMKGAKCTGVCSADERNSGLNGRLQTIAAKVGITKATLHRMRRTALTAFGRDFDIKTAMAYAGHKHPETIMLYLKAFSASSPETQAKIAARYGG